MIVAGSTFQFGRDQLRGLHNLATDTFMIAFFNTAENVDRRTIDVLGDITTQAYPLIPATGVPITLAITDDPDPNGGGAGIPGAPPIVDFADLTLGPTTIPGANAAAGAVIFNSSQSDKVLWVLSFGGAIEVTDGLLKLVFPPANAAEAIVRVIV